MYLTHSPFVLFFSFYVLTVLRRVPLISHAHFQDVLHNHKSKGHRVINHPLKSLKQWPDKKILLFRTPRGKAECCWQNYISRDTLQMWTTHFCRKHPIPSRQLEIKAKPSSCDKPLLPPVSLCMCVYVCPHVCVWFTQQYCFTFFENVKICIIVVGCIILLPKVMSNLMTWNSLKVFPSNDSNYIRAKFTLCAIKKNQPIVKNVNATVISQEIDLWFYIL